MEWNGMEWNGMEWNGMEWNGMEWNLENLPALFRTRVLYFAERAKRIFQAQSEQAFFLFCGMSEANEAK
jgi:hypothetical protein